MRSKVISFLGNFLMIVGIFIQTTCFLRGCSFPGLGLAIFTVGLVLSLLSRRES